MVESPKIVRTQTIPVWLTRQNYKRAHEATHNAALLWNDLVAKQAIAHDLADAIQTSRTLRKNKSQRYRSDKLKANPTPTREK